MPIFPGGVLCEESCVCLFAPGTLQSSSEAKFLANCDYTGALEQNVSRDSHLIGATSADHIGQSAAHTLSGLALTCGIPYVYL